MWMPSVNSRTRVFSIPVSLIYICLALMLTSWLLLGLGAYLGNRLYNEYVDLREQNLLLQQKEKDLEAVRQTMEQIKKDEKIIRNFLGLDNGEEGKTDHGQGGEPSPDLSTISPKDAGITSRVQLPDDLGHDSIVQRVDRLHADLDNLVMNMQDLRQQLDSTPSIIPVETEEYWFSSGFGWRLSPFTGLKEFHNGLDICGRRGTPIVAPANGRVVKTGRNNYLGKYLEIDHGRGIATTYAHLSAYNVKRGQKVKRGDVIALMGSTGRSTGTHVHYMVEVDNRAVNPFHYILNAKRNHLLSRSMRADAKN
jgi:murein DD-endopeptidase MepM/ murein hydrolase activator NlpD